MSFRLFPPVNCSGGRCTLQCVVAPQESVSTHRRPSDGLCRLRWRRSSVSTKQATASLARVRFVMSDRRPSGHRTCHMPGWAASGTTLGLRGLKRHPRCVRPGRASALGRALAPEASAQCESSVSRLVRLPCTNCPCLGRNTSFPPLARTLSGARRLSISSFCHHLFQLKTTCKTQNTMYVLDRFNAILNDDICQRTYYKIKVNL